MDFYKVLGQELKITREQSERSLSWVAKKAGISVSGYSCIERGTARPPMEKVQSICEVLGADFKTVLKAVIEKM